MMLDDFFQEAQVRGVLGGHPDTAAELLAFVLLALWLHQSLEFVLS